MTTNISSLANWNSFVGNTTPQNYILTNDLVFNNTISGNLSLMAGRSFNGNFRRITVSNIASLRGLFNLHSGNINTTISNLTVVCSNVNVQDFKGVVVDGSNNASILANGTIQNVTVLFRNSLLGNFAGGIVGCSSRNITLLNSVFDASISGLINSTQGGCLIGANSGVGSALTINNCRVNAQTGINVGCFVGNNSRITSITNSVYLGSSLNPFGISLGNTIILSQSNNSTPANKPPNNPTSSVQIASIDNNLNLISGKTYQINNSTVLSETSLGSSVINSSLRSVGNLTTLTVTGTTTTGNISTSNIIVSNSIFKNNNQFNFSNLTIQNSNNSFSIISNSASSSQSSVNNLFDNNSLTTWSSGQGSLLTNRYNPHDHNYIANALSETNANVKKIHCSFRSLMGSGATYGMYEIGSSSTHSLDSTANTYYQYAAHKALCNSTNICYISNHVYGTASSDIYQGTITTTDISGTVYSGEWLQLEMPYTMFVSNIQITPPATGNSYGQDPLKRSPKLFYLLASNDGVSFTNIYTSSATTDWASATKKTFNLLTDTAYKIFRLVTYSVGNNINEAGRPVSISDFRLGGRLNNVVGTYPPGNMTDTNTPNNIFHIYNLNNEDSKGREVDKIGSSSTLFFNSHAPLSWSSLKTLYHIVADNNFSFSSGIAYQGSNATTGGNYIGSITTSNISGYSSTSFAGEWLQWDYSNPKTITGIEIYTRQSNGALSLYNKSSPRNFILLGSNNQVNWNYLYGNTSVTNWSSDLSSKTFTFTNTRAFNYYRLCVNQVGNGGINSSLTDCFQTGVVNLLDNTNSYAYQSIMNRNSTQYFDTDNTLKTISGESVEFTSNISSQIDAFTITPNINLNNSINMTGEWIQIYNGTASATPITITGITMTGRTGFAYTTPRHFSIVGSNNNTSWELIYSVFNDNSFSDNTPQTFNFSNSKAYSNIRLIIHAIYGNTANAVNANRSSINSVNLMYIYYTLSNGNQYPAIASQPTELEFINTGNTIPQATYGRYDPSIISYNNNIYYFFGTTAGSHKNTSAIYTPATNTWTPITSSTTQTGRWGCGAVLVGDKIYFCGGSTSAWTSQISAVIMYNITSNTWTTLTSMPQAILRPLVATYQGNIYILGGIVGGSTSYVYGQSMYKYTVSNSSTGAGSWSTLFTSLPFFSSTYGLFNENTSSIVINNLMYIFGAGSGGNEVWAFNLDNNLWTKKNNLPGQFGGYRPVFYNNLIYLLCGSIGGNGNIYIYSPIHDSLTLIGISSTHAYNGWVGIKDNYIYVFGGYNGAEQVVIDRFFHTNNNYTILASNSIAESSGWRVHHAFTSNITSTNGWVSNIAYSTVGTYGEFTSTTVTKTDTSDLPMSYAVGEWIQINGSVAVAPTSVTFFARNTNLTRCPNKFTLIGSNNNVDWYNITQVGNLGAYSSGVGKTTTFTNSSSYKNLRLVVNEVGTNAGSPNIMYMYYTLADGTQYPLVASQPTSNQSNGYTYLASRSAYETGFSPYLAFTSSQTDGWSSIENIYNATTGLYEVGTISNANVRSYYYTRSQVISFAPSDITILGKNPNESYKLLAKYNNLTEWTANGYTLPINTLSDNRYNNYRFIFGNLTNDNLYSIKYRKSVDLVNITPISRSSTQNYTTVSGGLKITPNIASNTKNEFRVNHINGNVNMSMIQVQSNITKELVTITSGNVGSDGNMNILVSNGGVMKPVVNINYGNVVLNNFSNNVVSNITYTKYPNFNMTGNSQNGFVASTSSQVTTHHPFNLFDGSVISSIGWATAASMYNTSGLYISNKSTTYTDLNGNTDVYYGEWFQLQNPRALIYEYVKIVSRDGFSSKRDPRNFIILGSLNGSNWVEIQRYSNINYWPATSGLNAFKTFPLNNKLPYLYYRVVINRTGNFENSADQDYVNLGEVEFYTIDSTPTTSPSTVEYPFFLNRGEPVQFISRTIQRSLFGDDTNCYFYKSSSVNANVQNSLSYTNYVPYYAFDGTDTNLVFNSAQTYSAGNTTGSSPVVNNITGHTSSSYTGEWIQLTLPKQIILTEYRIQSIGTTDWEGSAVTNPRDWIIIGSNDENSWTRIDIRTGITMTNDTTYTYSSLTPTSIGFKHFRLCANKVNGGLSLGMISFRLFGYDYIPSNNNAITLNTNLLNMNGFLNIKTQAWAVHRNTTDYYSSPWTGTAAPSSIFGGSASIIYNQFTGSSALYGWQNSSSSSLPGGAFFASVAGYYYISCMVRFLDGETQLAGLIPMIGTNTTTKTNILLDDGVLWHGTDISTGSYRKIGYYNTVVYLSVGQGVWFGLYQARSLYYAKFSGHLVSV